MLFSVSLKRLACGQKIKPGKLVGFATRENQKLVWTIDYWPKTNKIGSLHKSGFITKWSTFDLSCSDVTVSDLIIDFFLDKILYVNILKDTLLEKRVQVLIQTKVPFLHGQEWIIEHGTRTRTEEWNNFPHNLFFFVQENDRVMCLYIPPQLHLLPENWNKEGERERGREREGDQYLPCLCQQSSIITHLLAI